MGARRGRVEFKGAHGRSYLGREEVRVRNPWAPATLAGAGRAKYALRCGPSALFPYTQRTRARANI